jgi:hypothetical protein
MQQTQGYFDEEETTARIIETFQRIDSSQAENLEILQTFARIEVIRREILQFYEKYLQKNESFCDDNSFFSQNSEEQRNQSVLVISSGKVKKRLNVDEVSGDVQSFQSVSSESAEFLREFKNVGKKESGFSKGSEQEGAGKGRWKISCCKAWVKCFRKKAR